MSIPTDVLAHARAAGARGATWGDYTCNDEELAAYCEANVETFDTDAIFAAFEIGRLECRARTWLTRWTTAPASFDGFQTETVEACGAWKGRELRRVLIDPRYALWHEARYGSGLHGMWSEDPREQEARLEEQRAARAEADRIAAENRAAGLVWMASASDAELDAVDAVDSWMNRGMTLADGRAERRRREDARRDAECVDLIARCRALVPEGATIVDKGEPTRSTRWGNVPGRDPHVWHAVKFEDYAGATADEIMIMGEGRDAVGSLEWVATALEEGRLRVARADEVIPPRPVLERIGHRQWDRIRRVTITRAGHAPATVWVGAPAFRDPLVLDDRGHMVRSKVVKAHAIDAYYKDAPAY